MKTCSKCGKTKPLSEFHKAKRNKDGYTGQCGECRRAYHRDVYAGARRGAAKKLRKGKRLAILRRYKQMKGCLICGEKRLGCLHYHAPNGHEEGKVSDIVNKDISWSKIKSEVFRCVVLCATHHELIHAGEIQLSDRE